jgi:hypothetical protein
MENICILPVRWLLMATVFLVLNACSEAPKVKPANTTVQGVVTKITMNRRRDPFEVITSYTLRFSVENSEEWSGGVSGRRVNEDDLQQIIGKRVTFSCYRELQYKTCDSLTSLQYDGRELIRDAQ